MRCDDAGHPVEESLETLIRDVARDDPGRIALLAPKRPPLTYRGLSLRIQDGAAHLREFGIVPGDRVVTLLPDGPEAAVAFLSVSALAACAPMNPASHASELEYSFRALAPAAVIIPAGAKTHAVPVAESLGIPILELSPINAAEAGTFKLAAQTVRPRKDALYEHARSDDALIFHTSGTTSRPKLVVHTRRSIYWAALYIARAVALSPVDRYLNFMPLCHSLGLTGGLLAPLAGGGSTVCTPGFRHADFFRWLDEFSPTWFAAVPRVHQSILESAAEHREIFSTSHLRFARSAGAPLPQQLKSSLEQALKIPVIDVYGMSEAPPIAIEQLPPARRKAGSVGPSAGPCIEVIDEAGNPLARGQTGEIVLKGLNIASRYWNNGAQNRHSFVDGWFRTGDQGHIDDDGFVFLTGRIKEMINRGGEKIAPLEVDEVLMDHPAVAQALTFPVQDEKLGEEIAAAVVLRENAAAGAADLQAFAAGRLAAHKIPRRVIFLDEMPTGATGKFSRHKLSETFARNLDELERHAASPGPRPEFEAPRNERERLIAGIWTAVLGVEEVGIHDNFFDSGGDSIRAAELLARVSQAIGIELPPVSILLLAPTIATLSGVIDDPNYVAISSQIAPIQARGSAAPFFCVGDGVEFRQMIPYLAGQPCFGIRIPNFEDEPPPHTVEGIAAHCRETLQSVQPHGPYMLGGWCFAGVVAFEMARQLEAMGETVALLALFDARGILRSRDSTHETARKLRFHSGKIRTLGLKHGLNYARARAATVCSRGIRKLWSILYRLCRAAGRPVPSLFRSRDHSTAMALDAYRPEPYSGSIVHFWVSERPAGQDVESEWADLARGGIELHEIPGDHISMFQEPSVRVLAGKLRPYLSEVEVAREIVEA